jgi:hypothetical protein
MCVLREIVDCLMCGYYYMSDCELINSESQLCQMADSKLRVCMHVCMYVFMYVVDQVGNPINSVKLRQG